MGIGRRAFQLTALLLVLGMVVSGCGLRPRRNRATPTLTPPPASTSTLASVPATTEPAATVLPTERLVEPLSFAPGRNDYVIDVDDTPREFLVYVPAGYDPGAPTPVVFMFHGSNQGGPLMYANTGWAAKAEAEDFIVVYPTSWKYRLTGETGLHEKWNSAGLFQLVEPGTELKDDVKFVHLMLDALTATFNVDAGRVYATGFSNGGGFVLSRLVIEMHTVFAAFATSGALLAGEAGLDRLPTGLDASVYAVMGSQDEKISEVSGHPLPFPVTAEAMEADSLLGGFFSTTTTILSLEPTYTVEYEQPAYATLTFDTSTVGAHNQFIFRMVNNMGHVYPSGSNNRHGLNVADEFWDFFSGYTLVP
jgi:poly(3-hydroxybutyrate) depolymerase